MKNDKKSDVEVVRLPVERFKGGGGDEGLATAPQPVRDRTGTKQKPGLSPVSGKGPKKIGQADITRLEVTILHSDDGNLFYRFAVRGRALLVPSKEVVDSNHRVIGGLTAIGILATSKEHKALVAERIQTAEEDTTAIVATRFGFEIGDRPGYFIFGDGASIASGDDRKIFSHLAVTDRFQRSGSLRAYEKGLAEVIRNQALPILLFFYALAQILKPFVRATGLKAENFMFELVGETSSFKSALTGVLCGSIWGNVNTNTGYARSWNMSDQNIEVLLREYNGHLLVLDEATLADTNEGKRAEKILNTVHRLSSGQGRGRPGEIVDVHSATIFSNSNQPIRSILPATDDVHRALEVRLISIRLPVRDTGFFDTIPEGFGSVREAMQQVFNVTRENHGLLARRFIRAVLALSRSDHEGLIETVGTSIAQFQEKVGIDVATSDNITYRRVQPFALAYATAVIAFKTGTLKKRRWGSVEKSIRRAWFEVENASDANDADQFQGYLANNKNAFVDARGGQKPEVPDSVMKDIAGFVYNAKNGSLRLAVPKHAMQRLGYSTAVLKQFKAKGILQAGTGLRERRLLRSVAGQPKRDIVYIFRISDLPPETRFWNDQTAPLT